MRLIIKQFHEYIGHQLGWKAAPRCTSCKGGQSETLDFGSLSVKLGSFGVELVESLLNLGESQVEVGDVLV